MKPRVATRGLAKLVGLLVGLLVVATVLLGGAGPAAAVTPRTTPRGAPASTPGQVQVVVGSVTPSTLTPTETLEVRATITNTGTVPLTEVYVRLRYRYDALTTRVDVQKWAGGDATLTEEANEPLPPRFRQTLTTVLPPRRPTPVTLRMPASALGLTRTAAAFGSRGIAVEVYANLPGSRQQRVGVAHTFVVWDPTPSQRPIRVTVLVPVTSNLAQGDASEPTPALVGSMQSSGRLGRLISTVQDNAVSWAIDPALLAAAYRAQLPGTATSSPSPTTPSPSPTTPKAPTSTTAPSAAATPKTTATTGRSSTGQSTTATAGTPTASADTPTATAGGPAATAASWLNSVRITASTNPPQVLPFADPDLTALAHNDGGGLLAVARREGDATTKQVLGSTPRSSIAWPYDGRADDQTARMLAGTSWQGIVLTAGSQPPTSALPYTPTGRSSVQRTGAPLQGLLYDEGLSSLLGRLGAAGLAADQAAQIQQRLLAELAAITAERPGTPRHLLIAAPRNWDPDPVLAGQVLDTLNWAPWVHGQSTDALLAERPAAGLSRNLHYPSRLRAGELSQSVQWAREREHQLEAFSPVLTAPHLLVPDLQRRIVSMVGVAWRGHREQEIVTARNPLQSRLNAVRGAVTVLPGSVANLLSHSGRLPVTVRNQLDQPVRVRLVLKPHSGLLLVGTVKPFTIGARSSHTSVIPVRALGNGEVKVYASLWTTPKAGTEPISQAPPLLVRIRSNWETMGLSVAGGLLGLLLAIGLFRSIRRGRKPLPPESAPDPDEVLARQESDHRLPAVLHRLLGQGGSAGDDAPRGSDRPDAPDAAPDTAPGGPQETPAPEPPIRRWP